MWFCRRCYDFSKLSVIMLSWQQYIEDRREKKLKRLLMYLSYGCFNAHASSVNGYISLYVNGNFYILERLVLIVEIESVTFNARIIKQVNL